MAQFEYRPSLDPSFVGRVEELQRLDYWVFNRGHGQTPIFITGPAGVGKTALLKQFLAFHRTARKPVWFDQYPSVPFWLDLSSQPNTDMAVTKFIEEIYAEKPRYDNGSLRQNIIVAIDGADPLSDQQIEHTIARLFNLKAVRSLLFTRQREPRVRRAETLFLNALSVSDAAALLHALLPTELPPEVFNKAIRLTQGFPLAAMLLAGMLKSGGPEGLSDLLNGQLYDVSKAIAVPSTNLVTSVAPKIITATEALVGQLKKQPQSVYDLPSRKFEELIAELLTDMGWEVELTQATRDGGKDILAYLNTEVGKLLCLVEAKRYRRDRKIGVGLVRTLYGTLCDYQANSAMLVTTSSFTADAHEFQKKHQYQLALREYGDIVQWIQRYKQS